jgi:hypothetical protein
MIYVYHDTGQVKAKMSSPNLEFYGADNNNSIHTAQ